MNLITTIPAFFWFEFGSLIVCILFFNKLKGSYLVWLIPFLLFITVTELTGWYLNRVLRQPNAWLFNFSVPIEYLFYTFLYYNGLYKIISKKIVLALGVLFFLLVCFILIRRGIAYFQNDILIAGNIIAMIYCCFYFYEVLTKNESVNLITEPMFWITCGVFLFNLGELSYTLFRPILTSRRWDVSLAIFKSINNKLIFGLYGSIIIGILCKKK